MLIHQIQVLERGEKLQSSLVEGGVMLEPSLSVRCQRPQPLHESADIKPDADSSVKPGRR